MWKQDSPSPWGQKANLQLCQSLKIQNKVPAKSNFGRKFKHSNPNFGFCTMKRDLSGRISFHLRLVWAAKIFGAPFFPHTPSSHSYKFDSVSTSSIETHEPLTRVQVVHFWRKTNALVTDRVHTVAVILGAPLVICGVIYGMCTLEDRAKKRNIDETDYKIRE